MQAEISLFKTVKVNSFQDFSIKCFTMATFYVLFGKKFIPVRTYTDWNKCQKSNMLFFAINNSYKENYIYDTES